MWQGAGRSRGVEGHVEHVRGGEMWDGTGRSRNIEGHVEHVHRGEMCKPVYGGARGAVEHVYGRARAQLSAWRGMWSSCEYRCVHV